MLTHIALGHCNRQPPHPADQLDSLGHANGPTTVQQIESMRTLDTVVEGRPDTIGFEGTPTLGFVEIEHPEKRLAVGNLKTVL